MPCGRLCPPGAGSHSPPCALRSGVAAMVRFGLTLHTALCPAGCDKGMATSSPIKGASAVCPAPPPPHSTLASARESESWVGLFGT